MAGIYIHIPFCKKKCSYCDFFSNTRIEQIQSVVDAEVREIELRSDYLKGESIGSIYFGGGSPSMLSLQLVERLMHAIYKYYNVLDGSEVTFECNPDDLTLSYLQGLRDLGINRISIGVQSFDDEILAFLNRRHNAIQAEKAIELTKEAGFKEISIDLMFGLPGMSSEKYIAGLEKGISFNLGHISAYHLNIEPNTVLYKKLNNKVFKELSEDESIFQFAHTIEKLKESGYNHYEVSNYARDGHESRHNWLYWKGEKYIGIGPSAHSYDKTTRQWNISNTNSYIKGIEQNMNYFERENLSESDKYNEYILTAIRTSNGISANYILNNYNRDICNHFIKTLQIVEKEGYIINVFKDIWALERKGIFILDLIVKKFYYL